jgi:hypothetical protein
MTQQDIITRIQKLLALADSPNEHEANLAAAKAQKLMDAHRISVEAVKITEDLQDEEEIVTEAVPYGSKVRAVRWKGSLAIGICQVNGCFVSRSSSNYVRGNGQVEGATVANPRAPELRFAGRTSDVRAAVYMFLYLSKTVDRVTRRECKGKHRKFVNAFRKGMVARITERLAIAHREATEEVVRRAAGTGTEMVIRKAVQAVAIRSEEARKHAGSRNYGRGRNTSRDYLGTVAGYAAGDKVSLGARGAIGSRKNVGSESGRNLR